MNVHFHSLLRPTTMPDTHQTFDRTADILEAAKRAFAEKGFDGASMQDLARAAGMSAGNFYRYFPSKDAIVAAMIARDLAQVKRDFAELLASSDPAEALFRAFEVRLDRQDCCDGPLWAEIDAAAHRKPDINRLVCAMEDEVCAYLVLALAHISGAHPAQARTEFAGLASFLVLMFKMASQKLHTDANSSCCDTDQQVRKHVIATIRRTISDLTAELPKQEELR